MTMIKQPLAQKYPVLPPWVRSRVGLGLTAAAARGEFELQHCDDCGAVQYPPREMCGGCLSCSLTWRAVDGEGQLLSQTILRHSHDPYFNSKVPWRIGLVQLNQGPTVVVHLHEGVPAAPTEVNVSARLDRAGRGVLVATPHSKVVNMSDDKQLCVMTCDPRDRKILITDAQSAVGQAMVQAVHQAGAKVIWAGVSESRSDDWRQDPQYSAFAELETVQLVTLDVTDLESIETQAAAFGSEVDILVNTAEVNAGHNISSSLNSHSAEAEMQTNYLGLLWLAQAFGPAMRLSGTSGRGKATAWVNLLSVYALSNFPAQGTYSASQAAAFSLSQCLRAEFQADAIRVLHVFSGPIDNAANQSAPSPKQSPVKLAREVVGALKDGVEDLYSGDVAQEVYSRFREDPKVLEKELVDV